MKGNNMTYNIEDMIVDKDNNIKTPEDKLIGYFYHIDKDLYVVYYNECYNKEKDLYRDFFKIEKHPKYEGTICGSKSNKVSIHDKLKEIKEFLKNIDENKDTIKEEKKLPVGIRLKVLDNSEQLILDYKIDDNRYGLKMKCDNSKTFDENYQMFKNKVTKKYPNYSNI